MFNLLKTKPSALISSHSKTELLTTSVTLLNVKIYSISARVSDIPLTHSNELHAIVVLDSMYYCSGCKRWPTVLATSLKRWLTCACTEPLPPGREQEQQPAWKFLFYRGWSHGCASTPAWDADFLNNFLKFRFENPSFLNSHMWKGHFYK